MNSQGTTSLINTAISQPVLSDTITNGIFYAFLLIESTESKKALYKSDIKLRLSIKEIVMTYLQQKTIDEMMRQGLHTQLDIAEHLWNEYKQYHPENYIHIPMILNDLIEKSNHEIKRLIH